MGNFDEDFEQCFYDYSISMTTDRLP